MPGGNKGSWPIRSKNELTPQQGHFLLAKVNVNVDFEKYFFDFARLAPTAQGQYILGFKAIPVPAEVNIDHRREQTTAFNSIARFWN